MSERTVCKALEKKGFLTTGMSIDDAAQKIVESSFSHLTGERCQKFFIDRGQGSIVESERANIMKILEEILDTAAAHWETEAASVEALLRASGLPMISARELGRALQKKASRFIPCLGGETEVPIDEFVVRMRDPGIAVIVPAYLRSSCSRDLHREKGGSG